MHHADPDFDGRLLHTVVSGEGGNFLGGVVLERLTRALEEDDERRKAEEEQAAVGAAAAGGQGSASCDPFAGITEVVDSVDIEELVQKYGDTMADLVHTQVRYATDRRSVMYTLRDEVVANPRRPQAELSLGVLPRLHSIQSSSASSCCAWEPSNTPHFRRSCSSVVNSRSLRPLWKSFAQWVSC